VSTFANSLAIIPLNHVVKNSTKVVFVWKYLVSTTSTHVTTHFKMLDTHSPDGEEQHPQIPLCLVSLKPKAARGNAHQRKCTVTRVLELFPEPGGVSLPTEETSGHSMPCYRDTAHRQGIVYPSLHCSIVDYNDAFLPSHSPNTGDDSGTRNVLPRIYVMCS
jgi:hypothetical protein